MSSRFTFYSSLTNFHPNLRTIEPEHRPEQLGDAVVRSLARKMSSRLAWGPITTIVTGLLSGGLLPLIVLPKRFRDFINAEQTHLWHFTEWMRLNFPGTESEKLQTVASTQLRFRNALWIGSLALALLAVLWSATDLAALARKPLYFRWVFGSFQVEPILRPLEPQFIFNFTARMPHMVKQFATMPRVLIAAEGFTLLLIAAHLLSLLQWWAHVRDVGSFVEQFNVVARKNGIEPVSAPRPRLGLDWVWAAGIVGLLVLGAWWGVPMMLAAAAQSRYINRSGRALRLALSARVRDQLAQRRPATYVPTPRALQRECERTMCNAIIQPGARFCSRCGEPVTPLDVLA